MRKDTSVLNVQRRKEDNIEEIEEIEIEMEEKDTTEEKDLDLLIALIIMKIDIKRNHITIIGMMTITVIKIGVVITTTILIIMDGELQRLK